MCLVVYIINIVFIMQTLYIMQRETWGHCELHVRRYKITLVNNSSLNTPWLTSCNVIKAQGKYIKQHLCQYAKIYFH